MKCCYLLTERANRGQRERSCLAPDWEVLGVLESLYGHKQQRQRLAACLSELGRACFGADDFGCMMEAQGRVGVFACCVARICSLIIQPCLLHFVSIIMQPASLVSLVGNTTHFMHQSFVVYHDRTQI